MDLTSNNVVGLLCVCTAWMYGEHMKQGLIEQQAWGKTNIIETKLEHFLFLIKARGFLLLILPTI